MLRDRAPLWRFEPCWEPVACVARKRAARLMPSPAPAREPVAEDEPAQCPTHVEIEMLYRNERHALMRFFTRYRASPDDARDLMHEAFVRLTRLGLGAGAITRPETYLRQIARNLLRDRAKAAVRHSGRLHVSLDDHPIADADEVQRLEARDSLQRIEAAMRRMKPRTREIFMAHRIHGLSYAEIAAQTGLSIKGVEKQMGKAIAQLALLMDRR